MMTTAWLRGAYARLDAIERTRSRRKPDTDNDVAPPRFSVVINEDVRVEFSFRPRRGSANPSNDVAGGRPARGPFVLHVGVL
jgi:hypothetical protein